MQLNFKISRTKNNDCNTINTNKKYTYLTLVVCLILSIPHVTYAEDTTCANGAGTITTGAVTGHKYCKSNNAMNWWNAYAWCDGIGKSLFSLFDCQCEGTKNCNGYCPEIQQMEADILGAWASTPYSTTDAYYVHLKTGLINYGMSSRNRGFSFAALCK